jgi:antitoxin component YwqK of YwqJK toxin-antitoxin module
MMPQKIILILAIISMPCWTFGQQSDSVSYSLVFKDCCTGKIKYFRTTYPDWHITDSSGALYEPHNNIVKLEKGKKYFLHNEGYGLLNLPIRTLNESNIDTVITSCLKVEYPSDLFTWYTIHLNCEDTLNDFYTEYYNNGTIRLMGNFINGRIKDSLQYFYSNGQLKSLKTFYDSDTIYKTYHPNGQLSYVFNSGKNNTISYFKDGNVKSKKSNSGLKYFNRYTKNQLWFKIKKHRQVAYYRDGHIKFKLKRKPLFFIDRFRPNDKKRSFIYKWISYDTTGTKAKEVTFHSQKELQIYTLELNRASEDFTSLTYYDNGKPAVDFFMETYRGESGYFPVKYSMTFYEEGEFQYFKDLLPSEFKTMRAKYESKYKQLTSPKKTWGK